MEIPLRAVGDLDQAADSHRRVDLRTVRGAALVVLLLRGVFGLVALAISALLPLTSLERSVSLWLGGAPLGLWLQRVIVEPWMRYDALWYRRIVEQGYRADDGTEAFHPLYPLLSVPFASLGEGGAGLALLIVSTLASVAVCVLFARYVAHTYGAEHAQRAAWLLLLSPPAFVLLAPYSESTFMALAVAALYAMQCERWWLAGLLAGLATLTRQQGLALALPLAWAGLVALRRGRARLYDAGALLLVPVAYGLVVAYRAVAFNDLEGLAQASDPASLLRNLLVSPSAEVVAVGQRIAWPWEPLIDELRLIFKTPNSYYMVVDLVLGWLGVLAVVLGLRWMHPLDRLYALGVVLLALCYYNGDLSPYMALPRHILIAFPLFVVLARWAGGGLRLWVVVEIALLVNLTLVGLFVLHAWVP